MGTVVTSSGKDDLVVTLGEAMATVEMSPGSAISYGQHARVGVAGSESTVAIGLARLGVPSAWISAVGNDTLGSVVTRAIAGQGVIVAAAVRSDAPTGLMVREVGILRPRVEYRRTSSAASTIVADDLPRKLVDHASWVHSSGITLALSRSAHDTVTELFREAKSRNVRTSLDINYRRKLWSPADACAALERLFPLVDVVFAGVDETALLWEHDGGRDRLREAADVFLARGVRHVVVTDGADGALAVVDGAEHRVAAWPARVVDAVGAGDAFVAGYIASEVWGCPPAERMRAAAAMGAFAVSSIGDFEGLPDRPTLIEAMAPGGADVIR